MNTLFIGRNIIRLNEIASTNTYTASLLQSYAQSGRKIPEGTVVIAKKQVTGRGQRGNKWLSEPGKNLTFSLVLYPSFLLPAEQFILTKLLSLAVYDLLKETGCTGISIKWPNDIYVNGKKICGMLIENSVRDGRISHTIAGIGLNINQEKFGSNLPNATSLTLALSKQFILDNLLSDLCSGIEKRYLSVKAKKDSLNNEYKNSLYRLGELSDYIVNGKKISAQITGVTNEGLLILEESENMIYYCNMKEVAFETNSRH